MDANVLIKLALDDETRGRPFRVRRRCSKPNAQLIVWTKLGVATRIWLGGRDSNPDNVVQRAVNGLRSVPVRSVLFGFWELLLQ